MDRDTERESNKEKMKAHPQDQLIHPGNSALIAGDICQEAQTPSASHSPPALHQHLPRSVTTSLALWQGVLILSNRPGAGIMEADDRQVTTVFTVIPPSALDKPSIMKRYHRRRTCSHTSSRSSPTMVTLHDTRFVECRWWNDGWSVKTVVT